MRRREFCVGATAVALAARASAQTSAAIRRLAVFEPAVAAESWRRGPLGAAMLDQLKRLKHAEGDRFEEVDAAARGSFLPPVIAPRRMWAGSTSLLTFLPPPTR